MKKLLAIFLAVVMVAALGSGIALAAKPGTDFNGAHYNLNIVGKKADWSGGGSYDNWDRHTMFVPGNTTGWTIDRGGNFTDLDGIKISMTQGSEFAVIDGNAFDDGECSFQLGPGTYQVYIVAKGKPGGTTDITGWVEYTDATGTVYYYLNVGSVHVTKSKQWQDATHIFYVSDNEDPNGIVTTGGLGMWVFQYLSALNAMDEYENAAYFWQYDNNGNKLVQVRFYKD